MGVAAVVGWGGSGGDDAEVLALQVPLAPLAGLSPRVLAAVPALGKVSTNQMSSF